MKERKHKARQCAGTPLGKATRCVVTALLLWSASSQAADSLLDRAMQLSDGTEQEVIAWRRHIHQHPELSWQETQTAKYVADALAKMPGYQVQTGIAGTGIKAVLRGGKPGPVVAIRAEMDALPVLERNDLPFKSTARGVYRGKETPVGHVCGHDAHVAMLLGAADVFSKIKEDLPGTIVLLFQPAEEGGPGNGGAVKMLAAGVLENPKVDLLIGQHISAGAPSRSISYRRGDIKAGANNFNINLTGKGGHGSQPWAANDPVIASAEVVLALQSIISHQINQQDGSTTLTVGMLQSGNKTNILPEKAEIAGTIRSFSKKNLDITRESMLRKVKAIADSWGLQAKIDVGSGGYDNVVSDPDITQAVLPALKLAAGSDNVIETSPYMNGDDFGAYGSAGVKTLYWYLNASPYGTKAGIANHSPDFVVDESAFKVGTRATIATALKYMESSAGN